MGLWLLSPAQILASKLGNDEADSLTKDLGQKHTRFSFRRLLNVTGIWTDEKHIGVSPVMSLIHGCSYGQELIFLRKSVYGIEFQYRVRLNIGDILLERASHLTPDEMAQPLISSVKEEEKMADIC